MIAVLTVYVQVCLGVYTLLLYVPVHLAAMHQSGALATHPPLPVAMWTSHDMKFMKAIENVS